MIMPRRRKTVTDATPVPSKRTVIAAMSSSSTRLALTPLMVRLASTVVYEDVVGARLGAEVGAGTGAAA